MTKQSKTMSPETTESVAAADAATDTVAAERGDGAGQSTGWAENANMQAASLSAFQGPIVEMASQAFGRYVDGVAVLNQEMTRFLTDRLRQDAEFGHALTGCQTFAEAADMQREWVRKAAEDYAAEAQRLGELGRDALSSGARQPSSGT